MRKYLKDKDVVIRIRLNNNIKKQYQEFCDNKNHSLSKRIRMLIEGDMNNEK